jgi:hypothetical protein
MNNLGLIEGVNLLDKAKQQEYKSQQYEQKKDFHVLPNFEKKNKDSSFCFKKRINAIFKKNINVNKRKSLISELESRIEDLQLNLET